VDNRPGALAGWPGDPAALDQPVREVALAPTDDVWFTDRVAFATLGLVTALAAVLLFSAGTLVGQDSATQFYPWYDYLGERLRACQVPAWNPYQFGGAPFAGDPQSGWMYVPAMLIFAALPLSFAVPTFIISHLLIAGGAIYLLARRLGLGPVGSLVAAIVYQLSGPVLGRSVCCPAAFEVATWAPVALLGAEIATRRRDWPGRVGGWVLSGFAVSQALAAWLGQGSYYLLLALGGFVFYRTVIAPVVSGRNWRGRVIDLVLHGGVILAVGFGLAAAAILPRLEYVARSNVAGGEYGGDSEWAAQIGGVTPSMIMHRVLDPSLHYPGAVSIFLVLLVLTMPRRWRAAPFFIVFGLTTLLLATPWQTPVHQLFYTVLPRFEALHLHWPERVAMVGFVAIALLAGAAVDLAMRRRMPLQRVAACVLALAGGVILSVLLGADVPVTPLALLGLTIWLLALSMTTANPTVRAVVPAVLVGVIAVDLLLGFHGISQRAPYGGFHRIDLSAHYDDTKAARFIAARSAEEPARYIGFDPSQTAIADGQQVLYRFQFADPETAALLVNNSGTLHDIEDAQGYNPVQPQRFVEYLTALNGHPQEYHDANIYFGGVSSPLLDLLNIRYIVTPATPTEAEPDLVTLDQLYPAVYADRLVQVLENREAFPRAWIVHEARQVAEGEALPLLATGEVDARQVALLETTPPALEVPAYPAVEVVDITSERPEHVRIAADASAPGLLVLSAAWDPGWKAYVNGEPADLFVANHLFQAVAIPAGESVVELRYEPSSLTAGMVISGGVTLLVVAALVVALWIWRRQPASDAAA
jgi:hypothetical protein